jgi:ribosome-associated translation inhibitor RaiA
MTEHSPDQEPRLLEGSSADRRTVTLEVVGGTVGSENVAYATERIEQLCRHAPGSVDCRAHLFALVDDHGRSMAIADAVLVLTGDVAICAGAQATTVRDAIDDLAARLDRRIMTLGPRDERRDRIDQTPCSATTRVSSTRERMPSLR